MESINLEKREESFELTKGMTGKFGYTMKLYKKENETYPQFIDRIKYVTALGEEMLNDLNKSKEEKS